MKEQKLPRPVKAGHERKEIFFKAALTKIIKISDSNRPFLTILDERGYERHILNNVAQIFISPFLFLHLIIEILKLKFNDHEKQENLLFTAPR